MPRRISPDTGRAFEAGHRHHHGRGRLRSQATCARAHRVASRGLRNIVPGVDSIYRWEGTIAEEGEQILLIKTVEERLDELKVALFQRHPYEVPEFVVLAIDQI